MGRSLAALLVLQLAAAGQGISAGQTYEESLAAKKNLPCVRQAARKYQDEIDFINNARDARSEIRGTFYNDKISSEEKLSRLMRLPAKYGICAALYEMHIPNDNFYSMAGRKKPSLVGSYEEQAQLVARESSWVINYHRADTLRRQQPARATMFVENVRNIITELPDSTSADVSIGKWRVTGKFLPRFNLQYGERGTIFLNYAEELDVPAGSQVKTHQTVFRMYRIVVTPGPVTAAEEKNGQLRRDRDGTISVATSYNYNALVNYLDFYDSPRNRNMEQNRRFYEFSKFISRLGREFDGGARFRYDEFSTWRGTRHTAFSRLGFRGSTSRKSLSVGAYCPDDSDTLPDAQYMAMFEDDFARWLSFGGRRQMAHLSMRAGVRKMPGMPNILSPDTPGHMIVILEERP